MTDSQPQPPTPRQDLTRLAERTLARVSKGPHSPPHTVFQTSTMAALLAGVYDGDVTVAELLAHGDFGLGTFNSLDGEMVILNGICHHLRSDGSAERAADSERSPFAVVTHFQPQVSFAVETPMTRSELTEAITNHVASANLIHAVRVTGSFSRIRTRTVARQRAPYPPLTEATQAQAESVFTDVSGTLAGFLTPDYEQGISVAGYHLHFLTSDQARGGHSLDFTLDSGTVAVDTENDLHLSLPKSGAFLTAALSSKEVDDQVREAEGS
jgi:acetolactate decarboxylase